MSEVTRRDFVVLSAAGLGGLLLAAGCGDAGGGWRPRLAPERLGADPDELAGILRDHFGTGRLEGVRLVGRVYARRFEPDAGGLADDLAPATALLTGPTDLGPPAAVIEAAIRTDLTTPDLVSVAGWQLARTEARLAALAHAVIDEG